ncbi:MAG: restriction endonuclease subunit S [Humidesulfovibrio sp.]
MDSEWKRIPLGEFVTLQRGHDLPDERRRPGKVPILGSFGVTGWHDEARASGPGVTVGRSGASFGVACYSKSDYWPLNTALYVIDFHGNDERFAYYLLKEFDFNSYNSGSAQPSLNRNFIHPVPVDIPPREEQRAIAHILGTLDDKIELNKKMVATLEAMARALFTSWFVDFEPVRAKAEGRSPGLPPDLAALFPSRLIDSELGDIPEGWEAGAFGRITSQQTERVGSREVVVLSAVATGKLARSDDHFTKRVYSKETNKYLLVEQWDFAYNPSRINIGSIGMLEEDLVGGVSPVYVVARPGAAYRWFLEFSLRRPQTSNWINTLASGSVRQSLSYEGFSTIPAVIPPAQIAEEFNKRWSIFRGSIRARQAESDTLAAIRDALLPKLISGELRIDDSARFLRGCD